MVAISTGICVLSEYDNAIFFKAQCGCASSDDEQHLCMSYNDDLQDVELLVSCKVTTEYFPSSYDDTLWESVGNWVSAQLFKVKQVYRLLTTGVLTAETSFLFESEAQIQDYITALQLGLEKLKRDK
jgi:hypothetical protein